VQIAVKVPGVVLCVPKDTIRAKLLENLYQFLKAKNYIIKLIEKRHRESQMREDIGRVGIIM
jgi:hypothetical protein